MSSRAILGLALSTSENVRSFISIDVEDPSTLAEIGRLQSALVGTGADLKPVESENTHVTLKFLGDVNLGRLEEVKKALDKVEFPPFELEVRGVGAFPSLSRLSIVWVGLGEGNREVERIYDQVERNLSSLGFQRESRGFNPHITVARVRTGRKKEELVRVLAESGDRVFGKFRAESVRLKQSRLQRSGPEYSTLFEKLAEE